MYSLDKTKFSFEAAGAGAGSDILKEAFQRYMRLLFLPSPVEAFGKSVSSSLDKLTVTVKSADESLQLATDNSCKEC